MKKVVKIIFILIIISLILIPKTYAMDEFFQDGEKFLQTGEDDVINKDELNKVSQKIYNAFFAVAIGVAVIIGAVIGIKIMTGSVEEKAKMKEMLIPYVIGCVVIFSVFTIWSVIVKIGTDLVGTGEQVTAKDDSQ